MKFGLKDEVINNINAVFAQFPEVEEAIIYGSRAKGNYKPGSDIDIALKGYDLDLSKLNAIEIKLDDLLLPYTLDVSALHQIDNPQLVEHINRVGIVLYKKE